MTGKDADLEGDIPQPEYIHVECPDCGEVFETHDVGDLVACAGCDETFNRFMNIVEVDDE